MATSRFAQTMRGIEDEEPWMRPHRAVMTCYNRRDRLVLKIIRESAEFARLASLAEHWEEAIQEGTVEFDPEMEDALLGAYYVWYERNERAPAAINNLRQEGFPVTGGEEFINQVRDALAFIERIQRVASQERRLGLRGVELTPEEAKAFEAITQGDRKPTRLDSIRHGQIPVVGAPPPAAESAS